MTYAGLFNQGVISLVQHCMQILNVLYLHLQVWWAMFRLPLTCLTSVVTFSIWHASVQWVIGYCVIWRKNEQHFIQTELWAASDVSSTTGIQFYFMLKWVRIWWVKSILISFILPLLRLFPEKKKTRQFFSLIKRSEFEQISYAVYRRYKPNVIILL